MVDWVKGVHIVSGVLAVIFIIILIIGQVGLALTDRQFALHSDSLYAMGEMLKVFWWAYLGGLISYILYFITKE